VTRQNKPNATAPMSIHPMVTGQSPPWSHRLGRTQLVPCKHSTWLKTRQSGISFRRGAGGQDRRATLSRQTLGPWRPYEISTLRAKGRLTRANSAQTGGNGRNSRLSALPSPRSDRPRRTSRFRRTAAGDQWNRSRRAGLINLRFPGVSAIGSLPTYPCRRSFEPCCSPAKESSSPAFSPSLP
jgi:hypothetical protein